jgi:hypothetical protein
MTARRDTIEVFEQASGKKQGWRFRFVREGESDAMLTSDAAFESRERATEVAVKINRLLYAGEFSVKRNGGGR